MAHPSLRFLALTPLLLLAVAPTEQASAMCSFRNLSGEWRSNDGGRYRVTENGNRVTWVALSGDSGRSWRHRFSGTRTGNVITGYWADFGATGPNGRGTLTLRVRDPMFFYRTANTGSGFGGVRWWRGCPDTVGKPVDE